MFKLACFFTKYIWLDSRKEGSLNIGKKFKFLSLMAREEEIESIYRHFSFPSSFDRKVTFNSICFVVSPTTSRLRTSQRRFIKINRDLWGSWNSIGWRIQNSNKKFACENMRGRTTIVLPTDYKSKKQLTSFALISNHNQLHWARVSLTLQELWVQKRVLFDGEFLALDVNFGKSNWKFDKPLWPEARYLFILQVECDVCEEYMIV